MERAERKPSQWSGEALERAFGAGLPEQLQYLILHASRRREMAQTEMMRSLGVTVPKWRALAVISRLGVGSMTEIAHLGAVDRTTMTRTIDQLVEEKLVERTTSPTDRRTILLRLTLAGAEMCERARRINRDYNEETLRGVSDEQREVALRVLQKIVDNMIGDDNVAYAVLTFGHGQSAEPTPPPATNQR